MKRTNLKSLASLLFIAVACLAFGARVNAQTPTYQDLQREKLHVDANGTVLADRPLFDCKNWNPPQVLKDQHLPTELAKTMISCWHERPAALGQEGASTIDIAEFVPGAPRPPSPSEAKDMNGKTNVIIYPFRVKWTLKYFYRDHNIVLADKESVFHCYVAVDTWYCGEVQTIKKAEWKYIEVQK